MYDVRLAGVPFAGFAQLTYIDTAPLLMMLIHFILPTSEASIHAKSYVVNHKS